MDMNYTVLNQLCEALGVDSLTDQDDSTVAMDFGDGLIVFIAQDTELPTNSGLLLYARIGALPLGQTEVLEELLEANLLGQNTADATLSLERYSRTVLLHWRPNLAMSPSLADLEQVVRQFADNVQHWTHVFEQLLTTNAPVAELELAHHSIRV